MGVLGLVDGQKNSHSDLLGRGANDAAYLLSSFEFPDSKGLPRQAPSQLPDKDVPDVSAQEEQVHPCRHAWRKTSTALVTRCEEVPPERGRSARRGGSVSLEYVEPLSDARTPLADFFSILSVVMEG